MTDCKILLEWPLEKLWRMFPIVLEPHRPCWHTWYEEEAAHLRAHLPEGVKIHHIGSTAIPGICAKPIIDLLVELPRAETCPHSDTLTHSETLARCKPLIERCGYLCMSECADRMSFNKGYTPQGYAERVFHLHLRLTGDTDECLFCDYLRRHPDVALAYGRLKQTLAARYRHDRDAYTAAKTAFVTLYTQKAREER